MLIGFYNYTVVLTYLGLASAVCGMVSAMEMNYKNAILCLLICGGCDMFDGTIARHRLKSTRDEKCFGMQIDSLCDLVCFGVFPAMICYSLCPADLYSTICMVLYVLAAVIRLAYFNVQEINRAGEGKREYYTGLPVTSSALIMPIAALITAIERITWAHFYPTALLFVGVLFVARFRVKKPYMVGLIALAVVGLAVVFLTFRYGGFITCMKPVVEPIANA